MKATLNHHDTDRPQTALDWQYQAKPITYPKGHTIARCGSVFLIQTAKETFAVVYGLETTTNLPWVRAASRFAGSCFHQAQCDGLTIE